MFDLRPRASHLAPVFGTERARAHRRAGLVPIRHEERHWIAAAAIASVVIAAAATATTAYAQSAQASAQSDMAKKVAKYNAAVAENQAALAKNAGEVQAQQREASTRRLLASQRVAVGASGVSTEGSPLSVMMDSSTQGAYEASLIRYGGEEQSAALFGEAGIQRFYGAYGAQQAQEAGAYRVGTTLLSGTGQALDRYANYRRVSSTDPTGYQGGNTNLLN
jgi:hypothetical protein